jgi:hypothetical protein
MTSPMTVTFVYEMSLKCFLHQRQPENLLNKKIDSNKKVVIGRSMQDWAYSLIGSSPENTVSNQVKFPKQLN